MDGAILISTRTKLKVGRLVFDLGPIQKDEEADRLFGTESSSGASMLLGPATVGFLRDAGEEIGVGEGNISSAAANARYISTSSSRVK